MSCLPLTMGVPLSGSRRTYSVKDTDAATMFLPITGRSKPAVSYFFLGILCLRMTPLAVSLNCLPHSGQSTYLSVTVSAPPATILYDSYSFIVLSSYSLLPEPGHTPSGTCLFLVSFPPLVQSSGASGKHVVHRRGPCLWMACCSFSPLSSGSHSNWVLLPLWLQVEHSMDE